MPVPARRWIERRAQRLNHWPPVGTIDFGDLGRRSPISNKFGLDRGLCVDRYYVEKFLAEFCLDIGGHVLEVGDDRYTKKYGVGRVTRSDVLHVQEGQPHATLVADLTRDETEAASTFDCIICTQTLHVIYDFRSALRCLYRILKPGGVLLATFAGISQVSRFDMDRWGDYWRFTTLSTQRVFGELFPLENIQVYAYGNVLASVAFLHGLAAEELNKEELDYHDPDYQLLIAARAVKPVAP